MFKTHFRNFIRHRFILFTNIIQRIPIVFPIIIRIPYYRFYRRSCCK
uniref:Uncharacterized protein n=1 Tax=Geladintestivirus 6 TaxID=3233138 RepID=A0AAU8MK15_9CAUD